LLTFGVGSVGDQGNSLTAVRSTQHWLLAEFSASLINPVRAGVGRCSEARLSFPKLMVSAGGVAQQGDISLIHVITLVKNLIAGKIH
jgi:hypothetical protein